jgi:hypothetical protein
MSASVSSYRIACEDFIISLPYKVSAKEIINLARWKKDLQKINKFYSQ